MANPCTTFYPKTNQVGFEIFIETGYDVTGATTTLAIRYTKPDKTTGQFPATAKTVGSKIGCSYVTVTSNDIDVAGKWTFQVFAESPTYALYGNKAKQEFVSPMTYP